LNSKPTVIVTGAAGYIGSHTIIELLENTDYHIVALDNYSNSSEVTYKRIASVIQKLFEYYEVDLCEQTDVLEIFSKYKNIVGVIHFAAFKSVPESVENPHKYYYNNLNTQLSVIEVCIKLGIKNFIFSSSCSVYGNIDQLPVDENSKLNTAACPYAYTKQIGEQILSDYAKIYPTFQSISLRYFNPVGAHKSGLIGEDPINSPTSLIPVITQSAIGRIKEMFVHGSDYNTRDGSCIRDYVHVSDIAKAHVDALVYLENGKQKKNYSIINLGSGNGVSVFEAISSFEKIAKQKLNYKIGPRREGDVEAIYSDCSLALKELGWEACHSLDEMIESAWKWENNLQNELNKHKFHEKDH
jgi:UDP-glucose 4-epimerase